MGSGDLIGRTSERAQLATALADAAAGSGSLILVAGDAGVGKTRLVTSVLDGGDTCFVRGAALPSGSAYGPIVAAFRNFLRAEPAGLDSCGPLRGHLAQLLPELGTPVPSADRATLVEAIRCGFVSMTDDGPIAILLDDLQWSDEATLELLVSLNPTLHELPLLVVCAYRTDEVSRTHPVRRLRHDLRRERALREIVLDAFEEAETADLLAALLRERPSPQLARMLHERTGGLPFFVEAIAEALLEEGRLERANDGMRVSLDGEMPLPSTVRDAVLVRTASLSDAARAAAELASVAGSRFDVALLAGEGAEGLVELLACGLVVEDEPGGVAFRHALVRDALYEDIPWLRRRDLHRRLAAELARAGAPGAEVAAHRLAARDVLPGLDALLDAIRERATVHAYRDAVRFGRQALDLWPEGERASERISVLEDHARHAELAGDLAEAGRAQREVVTARRTDGAGRALADAERRLAAIYALQGDRRRALAARRVAAEAYAANGLPGEAAAERIVIAGYLQSSGEHMEATASARAARAEAITAGRTDLQARAMGLEGVAHAKSGAWTDGMATIRDGLSLALNHGHSVEAAEVYQRLGTAHEITGDYARAREALGTAIGLCERSEDAGLEYTCLSCLAYVLRELGEWQEAEELCERLATPGMPAHETGVIDGIQGAMLAWHGRFRDALPPLIRSLETATRLDVVSMQCDSAAALAWLCAHTGDRDRATDYCRMVLERWTRSEDLH